MKVKPKKIQTPFLPTHVLPEKYVITVQPDLESATYAGKEVVYVLVHRAEKYITMHASGLEVVSAAFVNGKKELWASKIGYNEKSETVTFHFAKVLPKGKGRLTLEFRGLLSDKLRGYYRSTYLHEGKEKYLATTQFEPTDARRAFPCFDEPNKKAVFQVTVVVPTGHEVVSNTLPVSVREHSAGLKAVSFKPTPKMSTYLLAFVSGELESVQKKTKSGVFVRAFTTPGKVKQAEFALGVAVRAVEFFEKYFGIRYPLPALDLLAIPDFSAGAMENWGAITFRETAMLVDETSALSNKQWVALVVAHEVAHQWFGNLVTMDWWTHLWLNEGFASYMEYVAIDHLFPEWSIWTQFMSLEYRRGVIKDQLASSHPIEVPVKHPSEIDEIFDDISYRKGSSIIRMLASYIGEKDFRAGLSFYLKRHAYKNATTQDLWIALEKASGKPVQKFMSTWTTEAGLPMVRLCEDAGAMVVTQERFLVNPDEAKRASPVRQLWPIPISWEEDGKRCDVLLTDASAKLPLKRFTKVNIDETGFYRTCYTPDQLGLLAKEIKRGRLSVLDRFGVVHNAWVMAERGLVPTTAALALSQSAERETDYTVFAEVLRGLERIASLAKGMKSEKQYLRFAGGICQQQVRRLGFTERKGESHADRLLREQVLLSAGLFGDELVQVKALQEFKRFVKTGSFTADANLREVIYRLVAFVGGVPELNYFKSRYISEHFHEERERLAAAMASFSSPMVLEKVLDFGFSKHVRSQDFPVVCKEIGMNSAGGAVLWKFLKRNWDQIVDRYGGNFLLSKTVASLSSISDLALERDIEKFFKTHAHPGAERTVIQTLEHIHTSVLWKKRLGGELSTYFTEAAKNNR